MQNVSGVKNIVVCSLCCSLTCVCALFTVPIGAIPITLATLAVYISGALCGPFYGAISQVLYLALVFAGLPFTSKFTGGASYFSGPTAGYMIGYVPMAFLVGYIYKILGRKSCNYERKMTWLFVGCVFGTLACYFFGTAWYMVLNSNVQFANILKICVYPFLIGDLLKILIATIIVPSIEKTLDLK